MSPIHDTTYAVRIVATSCQTRTPVSPAAAWYFLFLFHEKLVSEPIFREKDLVTSALPEANRAGCPGRRLVWNRPHNSCS